MAPPDPQVFTVSLVDYLSRYFGVKPPSVRTRCETKCSWGHECPYVGCYMPWLDQINIKTGQEKGYITAHEFGHDLAKKGLVKYEGGEEVPAEGLENWYKQIMNEETCIYCGAPMFLPEDTPPGTYIKCRKCGGMYQAMPKSLYYPRV